MFLFLSFLAFFGADNFLLHFSPSVGLEDIYSINILLYTFNGSLKIKT